MPLFLRRPSGEIFLIYFRESSFLKAICFFLFGLTIWQLTAFPLYFSSESLCISWLLRTFQLAGLLSLLCVQESESQTWHTLLVIVCRKYGMHSCLPAWPRLCHLTFSVIPIIHPILYHCLYFSKSSQILCCRRDLYKSIHDVFFLNNM